MTVVTSVWPQKSDWGDYKTIRSHLHLLSFQNGIFPDKMKVVKDSSGNKHQFSNYNTIPTLWSPPKSFQLQIHRNTWSTESQDIIRSKKTTSGKITYSIDKLTLYVLWNKVLFHLFPIKFYFINPDTLWPLGESTGLDKDIFMSQKAVCEIGSFLIVEYVWTLPLLSPRGQFWSLKTSSCIAETFARFHKFCICTGSKNVLLCRLTHFNTMINWTEVESWMDRKKCLN